jgi:starch-binding outer membrane protein, SusD/RagB family
MILMRKYTIRYQFKFWIAGLLLALSSCSDWLQLEPESDLTREEFWRSQGDVEAAIGGAYKELAGTVKTCFKWGELRGDILVSGSHIDIDDRNIMDGNIYPENGLTEWAEFYRTINYANTILKFSPQVMERDQTFTENESKALEAEALYLRSLCYYYLVRVFRDVPLVLEASLTDDQDYYPVIAKEEDILAQLIADLKTAVRYLPNTYGKIEYDKGRATKSAAFALLADIYLHRENYAECIDYCDQIINAHQFALIDGEDWFFNFYPGNSNESIFEIQFDKEQGQLNDLYSMTAPFPGDNTYPDGNDEFRFSPYMVKQFLKFEGDRRAGNKTYLPFNLLNNHFILWKYIGTSNSEFIMTPRNGNRESDANWIIYRFADILLMKAEASIESGNYSTATQLINQIRKRAGIDLIAESSNKSILLETLLDERAKEFAGEGKRWFDLVRYGRRNDYENKDKFITLLTANKTLEIKEVLRSKYSNTDSWFLPINQNEIDQNSNLVQNPYYVNH